MIEVHITNLGKYNQGELEEVWATFPTSSEKLQKAFVEIGIGRKYEEYFITDYILNDTPALYDILGEYPSLEEINYLSALLETLSPDESRKYDACAECTVNSIGDAIDLIKKLDCFSFYDDILDDTELGEYYIYESGIYDLSSMPSLVQYIDCERFGRNIRLGENGRYTSSGYVVQETCYAREYKGLADIPKEYRLFNSEKKGKFFHEKKLPVKNKDCR